MREGFLAPCKRPRTVPTWWCLPLSPSLRQDHKGPACASPTQSSSKQQGAHAPATGKGEEHSPATSLQGDLGQGIPLWGYNALHITCEGTILSSVLSAL